MRFRGRNSHKQKSINFQNMNESQVQSDIVTISRFLCSGKGHSDGNDNDADNVVSMIALIMI